MRKGLEHLNESVPQDLGDDSQNLRKIRILESAELLFSGNAYEAVSIRDIATAADVNSALVRYYFGTKEQLFRALFERRYHLITAQRLARLQTLELQERSFESLNALVSSWSEPLLALLDHLESRNFIILLAREASDPASDRHGIYRDYLDPSAKICIASMKKMFPQASKQELVQAYLWMVACMMSSITSASRETRLVNANKPAPAGLKRAARLQRFVAGGIWAMLG